MMKKLVATAAICLAWAGTAHAADPVIYQQPLMSPEPISQFDWTGFYLGANAGYGGGRFDHPYAVGPINGSLDISAGGFVAGVQAGYNMQFNQWVAGVEADVQWSGVEGRLSGTVNAGPTNILTLEGATEVEWFGTLRGRLGYLPTERLMVYGTGGLAYGRVNSYFDGNLGPTPVGDNTRDWEWGWTIGAGVEYAFTEQLSMKTEYLYTDLGDRTLISGGGDFINSDVKFHTVRAGLNFHF